MMTIVKVSGWKKRGSITLEICAFNIYSSAILALGSIINHARNVCWLAKYILNYYSVFEITRLCIMIDKSNFMGSSLLEIWVTLMKKSPANLYFFLIVARKAQKNCAQWKATRFFVRSLDVAKIRQSPLNDLKNCDTEEKIFHSAMPLSGVQGFMKFSRKSEHISFCDRSDAYLFWLWNCMMIWNCLMTSKLVPRKYPSFFVIAQINDRIHIKVHTKEHFFQQQKLKGPCSQSHQFLPRRINNQNLQRFCVSKYRNCQVEWKSIKKPSLKRLILCF